MKFSYIITLIILSSAGWAGLSGRCTADDWPQFRGPNGTGVSQERGICIQWDDTKNICWKTALPGAGSSSPVIANNRIFLTAYSGYGLNRDEPGEMKNLIRHALCLDLKTGNILWNEICQTSHPETEYTGFLPLHGYASATPVCDSQSVYFFLGKSGVFARDQITGKLLWNASVGDNFHDWGSAASPILYKNLLIVNASMESKSIRALDKNTGKEVWRLDGVEKSWSTPALVTTERGTDELIINLSGSVWGINPDTGEKLWTCAASDDTSTTPSIVVHHGIIYAARGDKARTMAIKPGGRGDVTETHLLWECKKGPKVGTPVYYEGYLYWIDPAGFARCLDSKTGTVTYEKRIRLKGAGDKLYASGIVADGKIFFVSREDGTLVLDTQPEKTAITSDGKNIPHYKEIAKNHLSNAGIFNATPAIINGKILLRSDRYIYCIGH